MASKREAVLLAPLALLQTVPLDKVQRNRLRPERIPPEGFVKNWVQTDPNSSNTVIAAPRHPLA
jgi:hypothetical protein